MANNDKKIIDSVEVRGICASIQAMAFPTFENLNTLLEPYGYEIVKKKES